MESNIIDEGAISLNAAARAHPAIDGKRPCPSTIWRWMRVGVRGVRLEYVRLGRRIVTSRPALARFAKALAEADQPKTTEWKPRSGGEVRSDTQRTQAIAEAEQRLAAAGI